MVSTPGAGAVERRLALTRAVIPLLSIVHSLTMAAVYAVGVLSGCIVPFFRAAFRLTVPITVPRDSYAGAQSIVQGVSAIAELAAFGAAGWLVHAFGGPTRVGSVVRRCPAASRSGPSSPRVRRTMRARVESTIAVLATIGLAAGYVLGGVLGEPSRLGSASTLFAGGVVTLPRRCASAVELYVAFTLRPTSRSPDHECG